MVRVSQYYHYENFLNLNGGPEKAEFWGIYAMSNLVKQIFWHLGHMAMHILFVHLLGA